MTAREWSTADYHRDANEQTADANDTARDEALDRDDWHDDAPTRAELERDEYGPTWYPERERWRAHADEH